MRKRIANVVEHLKNHGIKPSLQRIKIFEYLNQSTEHPTVDMIYKKLVHEIPTLSKTTVYNTLKNFMEKKIVNMVTIEESEARFDAGTMLHAHFKCKNCNKVLDLDMELKDLAPEVPKGFSVDEQHVYFKGVCDSCQSK